MIDDEETTWNWRAIALVLGTIVVVMPLVWFVLYSGAVWPFAGDHDGVVTEQWCEDNGGDLMNHNVIGHHGGPHCHLDNGSTYHVRANDGGGVAL